MWYNYCHLPSSPRILRNAVVPRHIHNHPVRDTPAVCPVGSGLCIFRRERPRCFQAAMHFSTTHGALWHFCWMGLQRGYGFFESLRWTCLGRHSNPNERVLVLSIVSKILPYRILEFLVRSQIPTQIAALSLLKANFYKPTYLERLLLTNFVALITRNNFHWAGISWKIYSRSKGKGIIVVSVKNDIYEIIYDDHLTSRKCLMVSVYDFYDILIDLFDH